MVASKTLIIVESPGKTAKISQYLGSDYIVKASYGNILDLDKNTLSVDLQTLNGLYITSPDKVKVVKDLKALAKDCKEIIIASDSDREGEWIASSLASVLQLKNPKRIIFHEITKKAILNAIQNPVTINENMVNAQKTRRVYDRLVGYKISPTLWKHLVGAKSAGRTQSVATRIIIDKENEINNSISNPYFKTTGEFQFNKTKLGTNLQINSELYQFNSIDKAKNFLSLINKKTEFKVVSVTNKKSIRKPSQPFITSTLQQEASTKLHFNVKKTMEVAQKLYEAGLITYMRSDSTNISKEAVETCKKYIINTWGEEYSSPKEYTSKNENSQNAHECVRCVSFDNPEPEDLTVDQTKLYSLIWKRTIASQMSPAQVNVQTIQTDALNGKQTILFFDDTQTYFTSILENVEFPGYLIVYDNTSGDSEDKVTGKLEIKVKDKLIMNKIKIIEEYTKPPLRYNEAGLVKYLERQNIGRPSTFASIITKIIERGYVEIKNIDGIKKQSKQLELDCNLKLKEATKEILIGKEQKKIVPTELGKMVNEFMMKNFEPIMDIQFTANFETYLDKIAEGKANWITVLRNFYDLFHPIVEKLNLEAKDKKQKIGSSTDTLLGTDSNGLEIYTGTGKYGPYVKIMDDDKWKYASVKDKKNITLEDALELLEYPKNLGKIGNTIITLNKGEYGFYLKYAGKNISIKDIEPNKVDIDYAKQLIEAGDSYALKTFKVKDKTINIKKGEYGPYIHIIGNKKQFISIPSSYDIEKINIDDVFKIIATKNGVIAKKK
jgi:DNA topoisomerase-1